MKFYLAGAWIAKEEVSAANTLLHEAGHTVTVDWTDHPSTKPYELHTAATAQQAIDDLRGVAECDIFIIISHEGGRGMYVELGSALTHHALTGFPQIYAIGSHTSNSAFYFHPAVTRLGTIEEVISAIS